MNIVNLEDIKVKRYNCQSSLLVIIMTLTSKIQTLFSNYLLDIASEGACLRLETRTEWHGFTSVVFT